MALRHRPCATDLLPNLLVTCYRYPCSSTSQSCGNAREIFLIRPEALQRNISSKRRIYLPASMTGGAVSNSVACYEGIRLSARDKGVRGVIDASLDIAPPTLSPSDSSSTTTTSGPHALKSDEVFWRPLFLCPTSRRLEGAPSLDSPRHRLSTRCSTPPEWEDSDDEVPYSHPLVWAAATKRRML